VRCDLICVKSGVKSQLTMETNGDVDGGEFICCQLVNLKQTSVTKKKDSLRAMALDSDNNQIQVKDVVKVVDGPHSVSSCCCSADSRNLLLINVAAVVVCDCFHCSDDVLLLVL